MAALALVAIVPLAVSHYFLIGINRDSLETLEKKYLTRAAVTIATDVQSLIASNTQQLNTIAGSVLVMRRALPPDTDPFGYIARRQAITSYISPDSDLLALRILNAAGEGAEAKPEGLDQSILQELDLARDAALKRQTVTGTFQYVTAVNQPAIVIAVPVIDGSDVIGVVEGLVSLRRVSQAIREVGRGDVTAFLVDRNGRVLIHSEPSIDVQRPDFSSLKIVQEFAKAPVRLTESYDEVRGGESVKMLGTVAPVGRPEWGVVVQKPESQAYASVTKMIRATKEWISIAFGLAIIAAILFASGISRPIRILAQRTREIAKGNYQRVELGAQRDPELAENFNSFRPPLAGVEGLKPHTRTTCCSSTQSACWRPRSTPRIRTPRNSERVARSMAIGKNLQLPCEKDLRDLRISALLRCRKVGIDDRILRKPARSATTNSSDEAASGEGCRDRDGVAQLIEIVQE
jgi:hypothetical protein